MTIVTAKEAPMRANSSEIDFSSLTESSVDPAMTVLKRDGSSEKVDALQIALKVAKYARGLPNVDAQLVATKVVAGLYDGVTTSELDELLIQNCAMMIGEEPEYSKLAARLLDVFIAKEIYIVRGIESFYDSMHSAYSSGLLSEETYNFIRKNAIALNLAIDRRRSGRFEYFGLRTVYDRYLLKHPQSREVIETVQYFFMRVACGLAKTIDEAIEFYDLISSFEYMPSTPTLFNSGTKRSQMSSCYLLNSPDDSLESIYKKYSDVAMLSKWAGGVGLAYHNIRSRGSLIKGTNGQSNGIVPFLKTLDSSVSAVNQGGKRKGAACVYLESWHADIYDFLELRNNTGDESQRTHNLNIANWVPDLFMKRVKEGGQWSLFDPKAAPELIDLYGEDFKVAYEKAENEGRFVKQVSARDLYSLMMKTLAQTGNGWMTFKDSSNLKSNQTGLKRNVIHLSNLCTEILEVTSTDETAVCNLGSVNLAAYVDSDGNIDYERLGKNVEIACKFLDRVIDINFYPIEEAKSSNHRWRPVGLGVMGFQDVLFKLKIPFESQKAVELAEKLQGHIYYHALKTSCSLAKEFGPHDSYDETRANNGELQFDLWGMKPVPGLDWEGLREQIAQYGLRNSLMIAIAPTATIASIVGSYECIEPQVSNLFKRETLSGEFIQINNYLVRDLRKLGLWNKSIRAKIKLAEGSVQSIDEIPGHIKDLYKTSWELSQKQLINIAAARGPYIDQSQSLNLFIENPTIGKLSSMYMYAWEKGLKTTYYLRSRAATKINKTGKEYSSQEAIACSLENPGACEACQ